MLLCELKLLETDRTPLQTSLGQLGFAKNRDSTKGGAKDISAEYRTLIDKSVAQLAPAPIDEDELRKIAPTRSAMATAIAEMKNVARILEQQQEQFSKEVSVLEAVRRLASKDNQKAASQTQANAWLRNIEQLTQLPDNDIIAENRKMISDVMNHDRVSLIRALMNEAQARTWAQDRAIEVRNVAAKRTEAQDKQIETMIKVMHGVLGQMIINAVAVGKRFEALSNTMPN